jgi:hypothetical protein
MTDENGGRWQSLFMDGTNLAWTKLLPPDVANGVLIPLIKLIEQQPKMPVHKLISRYRTLSSSLLDLYFHIVELNTGLMRELEVTRGGSPASSRKRWTPDEDDALVDQATREDATMIRLALLFNRTPGAIQSRLTYLVGINRMSSHVVGHLTGYLDGEPVAGFVVGEVTR